MVDKCLVCRLHTITPVEPLQPTTLPERPWQRLGADVFEFRGSQYLIVVDYYSRWIEVRRFSSLSSVTTIESFKSILCVHGIPDCIISDNGPQFASREFAEFAKDYCFIHVTSSPRYPKANGEAERAVATVKMLWKKAQDPHASLLIYRSTPLANGFTPSELLMGRLLQTSLPTTECMMPDRDRAKIEAKESGMRAKAMENYNTRHRARELPTPTPGESVHVRDMDTAGVVKQALSSRSYVVETPKSTIRRNRSALIQADHASEKDVPVTPVAEGTGLSTAHPVSPCGVRVSGSCIAEGTSLTTAHPARCADPDKVDRARREPRLRRLPSRFDDYEMN